MRLSSQSNQFVFNLPVNFITPDVNRMYKPLLEKNWVQYDDVVSYLNSTIIGVSFPGISFDLPTQNLLRGKVRSYLPATNVQDIVASHELDVTFASVDADINYWLVYDILTKHYLDVDNLYVKPFTITCLDIHRDGIYKIFFYEIMMHSLSDNKFDYSQQKVSSKQFTVGFRFNFYDIEFLLTGDKILETGSNNTSIMTSVAPLIINNSTSINPLNPNN